MAQLNKQFHTHRSNAREMLIALGVGQFNVTMSLPYVWFMPRSCDPYAQGVMQLVQALQHGCNARGYNLELTGWMDAPTQRALHKISGPSWQDKTWLQLVGDVLSAPRPRLPGALVPDYAPTSSLGSLGDLTDVFYSPVALVAAGAAAWFLFGHKRTAKAKKSA